MAFDCALYRLSCEVSLIVRANKFVIEIEVFLNRSHDRRKLRFRIVRLLLPHRGKPQRINDSRRPSKFRIALYLRRLGVTALHNAHEPAKIGTQLAGKGAIVLGVERNCSRLNGGLLSHGAQPFNKGKRNI